METERLLAFVRALVHQKSISGQEGPVVDCILDEMRDLGFDRVWRDSNGSAIGMVAGASAGPTLLLDAHCDTVGIVPGEWEREPFGAIVEGDTLYGRGTADMKGTLAAMVHAAATVDRARVSGRVVVSATVMEEVMEGYSLATVIAAVRPDFVVIGEATDLNLNRGGRGRAEIHLETIGRSAHSSSPELGQNAVLDMLTVVGAIEAMAPARHQLLGPATMTLTDIISEPYPGYSVIPSHCRVTYDRRLLPGETPDGVTTAIRELSEVAGLDLHVRIAQGEHATYTGAVLRGPKFFPAWIFPEDHPFVQGALRGLNAVGLQPEIGAYRFCTNAAYSAGRVGVPTIGFGPAREGDAHVVDEHIAIFALNAAARGYRAIIDAILGS